MTSQLSLLRGKEGAGNDFETDRRLIMISKSSIGSSSAAASNPYRIIQFPPRFLHSCLVVVILKRNVSCRAQQKHLMGED
jgi:hypothetical protein